MEVGRGEVILDFEALGSVKKFSLWAVRQLLKAITYEEDIDCTPNDRGEGAANDEIVGPVGNEVFIVRT